MSEKPDEKTEATVKTVDRVATLLRALATHGDGAMLSAVARETGLGKGTVHRLLAALIDVGFVFQDPDTRRYRLGVGMAMLAQNAHQHEVSSLALPFLEKLAEELGDTIYASVREGAAAVCVAREIGAFPIRTLSLGVGDRRPLGVGSGSLALLAALKDDQIETILSRNVSWMARYPGHSRADILATVAETRRHRHSFVDGKLIAGMRAIGVPVLDAAGEPVAALSMAAISQRVQGERRAMIVRLLQRAAIDLGKAMQAKGERPAPTRPARRAG